MTRKNRLLLRVFVSVPQPWDLSDDSGTTVLALSLSAAQNADLALYLSGSETAASGYFAEAGADLTVKF